VTASASQAKEPLSALADALARSDRGSADRELVALLAQVGAGRLLTGERLRALAVLRRHRHFVGLAQLASALLAQPAAPPEAEHGLVQATIELGELDLARALVESFSRARPHDPELLGLAGRIEKQAFVDALQKGASPRDAEVATFLQNALEMYSSAYHDDLTRIWHGINAVALTARAKREGIVLSHAFEAATTAEAILGELERRRAERESDVWDDATELECLLALKRPNEALLAAFRFAGHRDGHAFAYASALRQLREIWRIDEHDPCLRQVTALLEARVLSSREGARLDVDAEIPRPPSSSQARELLALSQDGSLEASYSGLFLALDNLTLGFRRAESVGCIERPGGERYGTGFLVPASLLRAELGDEIVLVTNSHVIDVEPNGTRALTPASATVRFQVGPNAGSPCRVREVLFRSAPKELDVIVVRLDGPVRGGLREAAGALPAINAIDETPRVFMVGHPGHRSLSFSLTDNALLHYDERMLYYRAPTEPGSSGCPVFNEDWQLLGVHHAGNRRLPPNVAQRIGANGSNEGVQLSSIRRALSLT
jgi:hypothetical protein